MNAALTLSCIVAAAACGGAAAGCGAAVQVDRVRRARQEGGNDPGGGGVQETLVGSGVLQGHHRVGLL